MWANRIESDRRAFARLCSNDRTVRDVLNDLVESRFAPLRQDALVERLSRLKGSFELDAMELVDGRPSFRGEVLGSAHLPDRTGTVDRRLATLLEQADGSPFVSEVRLGSETQPEPVLIQSCSVGNGESRLWVVTGRRIESAFEAFARDAGFDELRLESGEGTSNNAQAVATFSEPSGSSTNHLVVVGARPRGALASFKLDRWLIALAVIAFGLALVVGSFLTRSVSRPLAELERAARRVGSGDLESTIGVRSNKEAARAATAFNRMTLDLKAARERLRRAERTAAWRDIARRIAHEVKNPLSPIQMAIETLRKTYRSQHPDFEEIFDESTRAVLDEVQRLNRLVSEFSDFARMPSPIGLRSTFPSLSATPPHFGMTNRGSRSPSASRPDSRSSMEIVTSSPRS